MQLGIKDFYADGESFYSNDQESELISDDGDSDLTIDDEHEFRRKIKDNRNEFLFEEADVDDDLHTDDLEPEQEDEEDDEFDSFIVNDNEDPTVEETDLESEADATLNNLDSSQFFVIKKKKRKGRVLKLVEESDEENQSMNETNANNSSFANTSINSETKSPSKKGFKKRQSKTIVLDNTNLLNTTNESKTVNLIEESQTEKDSSIVESIGNITNLLSDDSSPNNRNLSPTKSELNESILEDLDKTKEFDSSKMISENDSKFMNLSSIRNDESEKDEEDSEDGNWSKIKRKANKPTIESDDESFKEETSWFTLNKGNKISSKKKIIIESDDESEEMNSQSITINRFDAQNSTSSKNNTIDTVDESVECIFTDASKELSNLSETDLNDTLT